MSTLLFASCIHYIVIHLGRVRSRSFDPHHLYQPSPHPLNSAFIIMVKNRGIEISIISQFDIRRLPELQGPAPTTKVENGKSKDNLVSCYVPVYPGSQIWFEYTIEPPHPPNAIYFFKLLINGQTITSWDSTEKQGYHGKTMYGLQRVPARGRGGMELQQRGFQFCDQDESDVLSQGSDDCIEIRVHRVEHRRRVRDISMCADGASCQDTAGSLR